MLHKDLTQRLINAAKAVHAELGAGLSRDCYRHALALELKDEGVIAETDKPVEIRYRGRPIGSMAVDFCVDSAILANCVDGDEISPEEYGRLRTLLKNLDLEVGLLLRFNGPRLDVRRVEAVPKKGQPQTVDAE